jgi:PAS domain S-box-containing protein
MRIAVSILLYLWLLLLSPQLYATQQPSAPVLEKVTLQLKWFHQFQFAGYYAAKQQGFYAAEGLDVEILERNPNKDIVKQVISGEVDFAIGDSGIISYYARGEPIVALAAIFQHNPLVFISKESSGIVSPYEMQGKKLMFDSVGAGDAPLRAILAEANLDETKYTLVKHTFKNEDLINNKVDVMSAYLSDEIFFFKQKKVKINIINPQSYGVDFYSDILFTSQHELATHPERAEKFRRATLKGWHHALNHPEQLVQLIHQKYNPQLSVEHLRFEADAIRKLILPNLIPLGEINVRRLQKVAEVYAQFKLSRTLTESELAKFIYSNNALNLTTQEHAWLKAHPVIRLGIDRDFAPYEWIDEQGRYVGLAADYIARYEKILGVKFVISKGETWAETLVMAQRGELDMIACAVKTPERSSYLNFTKPFISNPIIIINDGRLGFVGSLDRLNDKRVSIEKGYFMQELLHRDYPRIKLIIKDNIKEALMSVAKGNAEAYVGDAASAIYVIQELGLLNLKFSGQTDYQSSHSVAVTKNNPELAQIMAKVLNSLSITEQEQIKNHWLSLPVHETISRIALIKYSLAVLLLFAVFAGWNIRLRKEVARRKALQQELRTLSVAIEQSPTSVVITDLEANLLYVNPRFSEVTGYSTAEVLGKNPRLLQSGLTTRETYQQLWEALRQGEIWQGEFINRRKNGSIYWEEAQIAPVRNSVGVTTQYVAVKVDITPRKLLEEKLKFLFDASPLGFALNDADTGNFIEINDAFFNGTGYSKAEFLTLSYWDLTPREYETQEQQQLEALHNTGRYGPYEKEYRRKDGSRYPVLLNGMLMQDMTGHKFIWSIVEDISERKQMDEKLRESESKLNFLVSNSPVTIYTCEVKPPFAATYISPNIIHTLGYTAEQFTEHPEFWAQNIHPDDQTRIFADLPLLFEHDTLQHDYRFRLKDGRYCWMHDDLRLIRNQAGEATTIVGYWVDITERKQMEQSLLAAKESAEQASQAKSDFLANMSHEIRTPMNAILGFTSILMESVTDKKQQQYLDAIHRSGKILLQLINDILDLSKIEAGKFELSYRPIAIKSIFDDIWVIFNQSILEKKVEFSLEIAENLPAYLILDEIRMRQVLLNIIGNAVKFTDSGFIRVSVNLQPTASAQYIDLIIKIADSGMGIAPDQIEAVFEAFTQQKQQSVRYGGTGLGLTICKRLISMMDGSIYVESRVGQGSCFTIRLPHVEVSPKTEKNIGLKQHVFRTVSVGATDVVSENIPLAENLPELVHLLFSYYQTLIADFHDSGVLQIDDLINISDELIEIAAKHHCSVLTDWALRLKNQAEMFDLNDIPITLKAFENLLAQLSRPAISSVSTGSTKHVA